MAVRKQVGQKKIVAVLIHGGAIAFDDETLDALDGIMMHFTLGLTARKPLQVFCLEIFHRQDEHQ